MSTLHQLALTRLPGVGPVLARKLLEHYGHAETVFRESEKDLLALPGFGKRIARSFGPSVVFTALKEAEAELEFIEQAGIRLLYYKDEAYPRRLKDCCDAPLVLFCQGQAFPDRTRVLSIVGSRKATREGKRLCDLLIKELRPYDPLIISGLAYGIDVTAHEAALKNGLPTIGVLGHGMSHMYPAAHHRISREMIAAGGLLSEWFHDTPAAPGNFPRRNRIVAGLADATVVVEAGPGGGALITADIAASYDRDVFAFPGRAGDANSQGCLRLIRDHKAQLITGAADLVWLLGWEPVSVDTSSKPLQSDEFLPEERDIMQVISENDGVSIDKLLVLTKYTRHFLCYALINLEIGGYIENIPGKGYVLT